MKQKVMVIFDNQQNTMVCLKPASVLNERHVSVMRTHRTPNTFQYFRLIVFGNEITKMQNKRHRYLSFTHYKCSL